MKRSDGWIDGWDAVNVRISVDGGLTWELLIGDDPYDFYSGYGWIYNGEKVGENGTHSLASGWSVDAVWHQIKFDLSDYADKNAIIRSSSACPIVKIVLQFDPMLSTNSFMESPL